jgi:hypothetical protein
VFFIFVSLVSFIFVYNVYMFCVFLLSKSVVFCVFLSAKSVVCCVFNVYVFNVFVFLVN